MALCALFVDAGVVGVAEEDTGVEREDVEEVEGSVEVLIGVVCTREGRSRME